jgi:hypothetical protein
VRVRVWVHKSPIAGLGLFAAQDIMPGTRIRQYIGEKISKDESTRRLAQGNVYIRHYRNALIGFQGRGIEDRVN